MCILVTYNHRRKSESQHCEIEEEVVRLDEI